MIGADIRDADLIDELEAARGTSAYEFTRIRLTARQSERDRLAILTPNQRRRSATRSAFEAAPPTTDDLRHVHSVLAICGLPYKRMPIDVRMFERRQGNMALDVSAGQLRDDRGERPRVLHNALARYEKCGAHAIALEQYQHVPGLLAGPIIERQRHSVPCVRTGIDAVAGRDLAHERPNAPESLLDGVGGLRAGNGILRGLLGGSIDGGLRRLQLDGGLVGSTRSKREHQRGDDDESSDCQRDSTATATNSSLSSCAARRSAGVGHALTISQGPSRACEPGCYSHSIVPGGFEVTS